MRHLVWLPFVLSACLQDPTTGLHPNTSISDTENNREFGNNDNFDRIDKEDDVRTVTFRIYGSPSRNAYQNLLYEFKPTSNSGSAVFSIQNKPFWASFDYSNGRLWGRPSGQGVFSNIVISATKNGQRSSLSSFSIHVSGDPLVKHAWHLENTRQKTFAAKSGTLGMDLNLDRSLDEEIFGEGVRICVSDGGIEGNHEDLTDNFDLASSRNYALSYPYSGNPLEDSRSDSRHGTAVSGVIAAKGWNGVGSRGIAPKARLIGYNVVESSQSDSKFIHALTGNFDILNQSWGLEKDHYVYAGKAYREQVEYNAMTKREGLGVNLIRSSGNGFLAYRTGSGHYFARNATSSNYNNSPYAVVVAALGADGQRASYSSMGSSIWVSAPGGESGEDSPSILTTDRSGCSKGYARSDASTTAFDEGHSENTACNYTASFSGSSAAAPMVSGVVALLLEANPTLSWRDVKYILAKSTKRPEPGQGPRTHPLSTSGHQYDLGWVQNAAGFYYNNSYGFGRVDASKAIELAQNYQQILPPLIRLQSNSDPDNWHYSSGSIHKSIPDDSAAGVSDTIFLSANLKIESVILRVDINHPYMGDIGIELTSPSGTRSILFATPNVFDGQNFVDVRLITHAFYGEDSFGTWKITVKDVMPGDSGRLDSWKINVFGH